MRFIWDDHDRLGHWVCDQTGGVYREGVCIGLEHDDGSLAAAVLYDNYNGASIQMHVAATTPKFLLWKNYIRACFGYPFLQLGCAIVIALVPAANVRARRMDEWLGFELACGIPQGHPTGDMLIYTMPRAKCRWLEEQDEWW